MNTDLVQLKNAFVTYSGEYSVYLPDVQLQSGQELALVGASGSGKSTALHALAGLVPVQGLAVVAGTDLTKASNAQLETHRRKNVALLFQDFYLLEGYTALENVIAAFGLAGQPLHNAQKQAKALLERVEMKRFAATPAQLSTGERQRVALARALAGQPQLILADEPTAHLDAARGQIALKLLREICGERQAALLIATHDPVVMEAIEQRIECGDTKPISSGVAISSEVGA